MNISTQKATVRRAVAQGKRNRTEGAEYTEREENIEEGEMDIGVCFYYSSVDYVLQ